MLLTPIETSYNAIQFAETYVDDPSHLLDVELD